MPRQTTQIAPPVLRGCAASLAAPQSMFADLNVCAADDAQLQREQLALAARLGAGAQLTRVAGAANPRASTP